MKSQPLDTSEVKSTCAECPGIGTKITEASRTWCSCWSVVALTACLHRSHSSTHATAHESTRSNIVFAVRSKRIEEPCRSGFSWTWHSLYLRSHPFRVKPHDFIPLFSGNLLSRCDEHGREIEQRC